MTVQSCSKCARLDVITYTNGDAAGRSIPAQDITQITAPSSDRLVSYKSDVTLVFAEANTLRHCEPCRTSLSRAFGIPEFWWSGACKRANGYFGCEEDIDQGRALTSVRTWARFLVKHVDSLSGSMEYYWYKLNMFTRWQPSTGETVILVFDMALSFRVKLGEHLFKSLNASWLQCPLWMYARLLEDIVEQQDNSVWAIRDHVRAVEKKRPAPESPRPDYVNLHDLSRHAIHVSEALELSYNLAESIVLQHGRLAKLLPTTNAQLTVHEHTQNRLQFLREMLRSLRCRATSNKERLQNEIQLAFSVVSQFDSRISVDIARATQADSMAMRNIAFVTMAFLPATFVCAVFSMSFFNYDTQDDAWRMSGDFWRYWAVAIPLTLVTTAACYGWHRSALGKQHYLVDQTRVTTKTWGSSGSKG